MNAAQLNGMRQLWDEVTTPVRRISDPVHGDNVEARTAKEMALVPHRLSPYADRADEPNGKRWGWSVRLDLWLRYE